MLLRSLCYRTPFSAPNDSPCSCCHPHGVGNDSAEPFSSLYITPLCCFLRSAEGLMRRGPKCGQGHTSKPPTLEHRIGTTYGPAGCWAPRHDAVRTGGLRGENEERCKLVPEKESKWRFWMCKVHQLRSHFPSSSSPIGREVGEELATPLP